MLLILSIVNAVIRETLYAPKIGEHSDMPSAP